MLIVQSRNGIPIRLSDERWQHISRRHPEVQGKREEVLQTVADPDIIQEGDYGALLAFRSTKDTREGSTYLAVAYREINEVDGFILTAYQTRRPSTRRSTIWKKSKS